MTTTFTYEETLTLTTVACCNCGVMFGVPERLRAARREDHGSFYCPNGHGNHYPAKNEAEQLRERLQQAEAQATHWRDQAEAAERSARSQRGENTKLRRRVANGVCPCCKRSFANLHRHMAGQHPDYAEEGSHGH